MPSRCRPGYRPADRTSEPTGIAALSALSREIAARAPRRGRQAPSGARAQTARHRATTARATAAALRMSACRARPVRRQGRRRQDDLRCGHGAARWRRRRRRAGAAALGRSRALAGRRARRAVGNEPQRIPARPANLAVRELDAGLALRRARDEYAAAIDGIFDRAVIRTCDVAHDWRVMHGLVDLAPPGLDELVAVAGGHLARAGGADARPWDLVVIDTAPTGHALRLLEMPALHPGLDARPDAHRPEVPADRGGGKPRAAAADAVRRISALRAMLADRQAAQFVVVTRAAALPRAETCGSSARCRGSASRCRWSS